MVQQEPFYVEQFMDQYEQGIKFNMGETCVDSLSVMSLIELADPSPRRDSIATDLVSTKLTYGDITGSKRLKLGILKLYGPKNEGLQAVVTNGAIGGNFLSFYSMVGPQDIVIVVDPSYQQLSSVPRVFSGTETIPFPLSFGDKFLPNLDLLEELMDKHQARLKMVVINNPNNPTGVVWGDSIMRQIVDLCRARDVWFMCDEVYRPLYLSTEDVPDSVVNYGYDKTISTSSASKAFSLAGVRLGWIVTPNAELAKDLLNKRDYNTISILVLDDLVASLALENAANIMKRNYNICKTNLELISDFVDKNSQLDWIRPSGGSTCFLKVNVPGIETLDLCKDLATKYSTLIVPGEVFGHPGFLRIGFGNSTSDIEGGLRNLGAYLQNLK